MSNERLCRRAQWEIRELATRMHRLCMEVAPELFKDAGPACLRGGCDQGEKSCGKMLAIRNERKMMINEMEG